MQLRFKPRNDKNLIIRKLVIKAVLFALVFAFKKHGDERAAYQKPQDYVLTIFLLPLHVLS